MLQEEKKQQAERAIDLELTNSCNTSCIFCPRQRTPNQGFMRVKTFDRAVERAQELTNLRDIHFCGLGEPLLHPKVVDFSAELGRKGIPFNITTNGFYLDKELARRLLAAGLRDVTWSISGIDETYERIHRLDFRVIRKNILDFIEIADGRCKITVSITIVDENRQKIDEMVEIWEKIGIENFVFFDFINRGGAVDKGYYFTRSNRFFDQARELMAANGLFPGCAGPYLSVFIGWDGSYYLCCMDYEKVLPLGSVFDYGIPVVDTIKEKFLRKGCKICRLCDTDTVNIIRELLFRIEKREASREDLDKEIENIRQRQAKGLV